MRCDRRGAAALTLIVLACMPGAVAAQTPSGPSTGGNAASAGGPGAPAGQRMVTVNVPEPGPKFWRILPSPDGKQQDQLPKSFSDKKVVIPLDPTMVGKSPKIAIDDEKTGNTAIKPVPENNEITLLRPDFDRVHFVNVRVTWDNKPVQVASVKLDPFDKVSQTQVIDAARQGVATFRDVAAGKGKLTIVYGDNFTQTQDIVVTTDHPGQSLDIPAPVSNKVATVDVAAATTTTAGATAPNQAAPAIGSPAGPLPTAPAPAPDTGGGIGGFLGEVLALAVVGGGVYLFWKWFQSGGFAATMKKVGIEVSGPTPPSDAGTPWQPNAPAAPIIADPTVCQFCGQKRDAAGNCACSLAPGSSASPGVVAGAGPAVATQPRLVATMGVYSGSIFPLSPNGAGITLGRDTTNSIPLDNDTTVSRRHASIRSSDGASYTVVDEGSSNGVYVNGVRISGSQTLRPGDEVQIGNTRFRFEL